MVIGRPLGSGLAKATRPYPENVGDELGWQVPFGQVCRLIQGIDLLLNKRKIMNWIEDHVLTVVAAWVSGDDLAAAADHDRVNLALDPDVPVAESDRDRVVFGLVTHQRL